MLDDSAGSEMNSMYSQCLCVCFMFSGVNISMQVSPENLLGTATLSEYFRSCFHVMHYVTFIFLEIVYVVNYGGLMYDYTLQLCGSGANYRVSLLLNTYPGGIV